VGGTDYIGGGEKWGVGVCCIKLEESLNILLLLTMFYSRLTSECRVGVFDIDGGRDTPNSPQ
jgi:hypothetical protein